MDGCLKMWMISIYVVAFSNDPNNKFQFQDKQQNGH
uniref:Uncharacterized protein n=1 Tax=Tetranychus urticae TaxID=32264 RepID=T1KPY9_TETUR